MEFNYSMPTQIIFGKDCIMKNTDVLLEIGKMALIVCGQYSAKKNGALDDIIAALKAKQIDYTVFDEIEENPSLETIEKGAKVGKEKKADFVIGIGGGSPLDAAKGIALMVKNPKLSARDLFTPDKLEALPVVAVPTTSGTGSEVTQYAIVTDHEVNTKRNLGQSVFPKVAFLDAKYTYGISDELTINTAIDALSHLVESYLSVKSNFMSEVFVKQGLSLWGECVKAIKTKTFSASIREKLLLASTFGGMAIAMTGTSLPHGMGYHLTYYKNVPHGRANGILYPAYLKCFKNRARVDEIVTLLGFFDENELENFLKQTIQSNVVVTKDEIASWTKNMMENRGKLVNHPEEISYEEIYNIYHQSLLGN